MSVHDIEDAIFRASESETEDTYIMLSPADCRALARRLRTLDRSRRRWASATNRLAEAVAVVQGDLKGDRLHGKLLAKHYNIAARLIP